MGNGYRENTDLHETKEPDQVSLSSTVHKFTGAQLGDREDQCRQKVKWGEDARSCLAYPGS